MASSEDMSFVDCGSVTVNIDDCGRPASDDADGVGAGGRTHEIARRTDVAKRLRRLVDDTQELSEAVIQEIRVLLSIPLPAEACAVGVEDVIAPIRAKLWGAMLLGLRPDDLNSQHNLVSASLHGRTIKEDHAQGLMHFPKEDQRVLAADIKRTRQAYAMFKRDDVMDVVSKVLERYCVGHGIRYKQGQNELIAPFVMLQDPPLPLAVLGLLFESFMSRFVSRWFVDDEIEALLVSYRVFRVLLYYLDPGLARKLDKADFVPELYATAWLITLFSRNLSLELVMRLWDVYLAINDPALVFLLLAALLIRNRETLMKVDQAHMMPETVQGLTVRDAEDLEELIVQTREMLRKIPESFLKTVRSCCSDHGNTPLDTTRSLFCESVRCVPIEPAELLERMEGRAAREAEGSQQSGMEETASPSPLRPGPVDTVALDIRPLHEYENSGIGHLGKSVRLDPCLLGMGEILEKWLQHFDGTKWTHVCLVDSVEPAAAASADSSKGDREPTRGGGSTELAAERIVDDPLWRRLLFGEGEGLAPGEEDWVDVPSAQRRIAEERTRSKESGADAVTDAAGAEGFSSAKAFAEKLHARGFPYVSILEGGMEALVEHLHDAGRPLEPTVINHDPVTFKAWREAQAQRQGSDGARRRPREAVSRAGEAFSWRGKSHSSNSDALQQEYSSPPATGALPAESVAGREGREQVGLMDRLGLMQLKDGVTQGVGTVAQSVGTVARTGAWAVRGGAGLMIPSSLSTDSANGGGEWSDADRGAGRRKEGRARRPHARTNSGNIWQAQQDVTRDSLGSGRDGEADSSSRSIVDEAQTGSTSGHGSGRQDQGAKDNSVLMRALETAEMNGHTSVAKAIRARLGFVKGQALRAQLTQEGTESELAGTPGSEVLESLADLA